MTRRARGRRRSVARGEQGFTLIELLVVMTLMGLLGGVVVHMLTALRAGAQATTAQIDLTAEARTALGRITGDLREATPLTRTSGTVLPAITAVTNPDGPSYDPSIVTAVTFNLDVSGDGCIAGLASKNLSDATSTVCSATSPAVDPSQPESETICWDPLTEQVYLLAVNPSVVDETVPVTSCGGGVPLLAGHVTAFKLIYTSTLYRYQNPPGSGTTKWTDLDGAGPPVGNNDNLLDNPELGNVDSVGVTMTLSEDHHTQAFTGGTELRNVHPIE